jgi:diguanylate cyclase (GGDEF)-like protein
MTTDQAQAPKGDLPSLSKGQKVLASVVALLLIGTIVSLLAGWLTRSGSIYTRSTETARSNAVFTMREGFNTAVAMEQYLGGAASRRDVQVARALLARRLSVIDFKGQSAAANAAQSYAKFVTDLNNFDTFLRAVPGGTLTPAQQAELRPRGLALSKQLALSSAQVGDVDSGNYKREALAFQAANEGLAASNRRDLILLSLSLITGALLLIWLTRDLRRRFARSSQSLEEERERVRQAQIALDRSAILETGQSRILKHIAAGAPVVELLHSVVKLASDATGGRPFRIVSGSRVISSRGMDGAQSTSAIAKQWPFGFSADEELEPEGFLQAVGDQDQLTDQVRNVGQICAELASLAVERQRVSLQLSHQATHDALTGLPNRTLLFSRIKDALLPSATSERSVAVLFCDLDRFKAVNDSLGHPAGDRLLAEVGTRLMSTVRGSDTVARLGGDEFVILAPALAESEDAVRLAERIREAISEPYSIDGKEVFVGASIGIAYADFDNFTPETLVRQSDVAMFHAKEDSDTGIFIYDSTLEADVAARLDLDAGVRRAVERDELRFDLQPIVSMRDSNLRAFEALMRWERPGVGLVMPSDFIESAEASGAIVEMGYWILNQAVQTLARWQRDGQFTDIRISVNVAARQLREPRFGQKVLDVLEMAGISPSCLIIELTESTLIESSTAHATLDLLRSHGIAIALDDFGTGYSSLTQLRSLPVDIIKLDRSFVLPLADHSEAHSAITTAVVRLAQAMSLELIIEGIETEEERDRFLALGDMMGQGYLFGHPVMSDQAAALPHLSALRA